MTDEQTTEREPDYWGEIIMKATNRDKTRVIQYAGVQLGRCLTVAEKELALAYADSCDIIPYRITAEIKNLMYRGDFLPRDKALASLLIIGDYNEFNPELVIGALVQMLSPEAEIAIGREYSPVLYIRVPDDGEVDLAEIQERVLCNEADYTEEGEIRLWWD